MQQFKDRVFRKILWMVLGFFVLQTQMAFAVVAKDDIARQKSSAMLVQKDQDTLNDPQRRCFLSAAAMEKHSTMIMDTADDRLLITTGDTIFLTNSPTKNMQKNNKYMIYKYTKKRLPKAGQRILEWYEEVGQVKILENHDKISIGLVIAARDIIHKGDIVFLGNEK